MEKEVEYEAVRPQPLSNQIADQITQKILSGELKAGERLIGPFEIEQALCRHPAVFEAAVISKSNQRDGRRLKAFVSIHKGFMPSNRLNQEIKAFVKGNLSPDLPLKELEFLDELPKTATGKLLRRVLRARELGLPGGDLSKMKDLT